MPSIIDRVLKISDNRVLKRMQATVDAVNLLEDDFRALSDAEPVSYTHLTLPTTPYV